MSTATPKTNKNGAGAQAASSHRLQTEPANNSDTMNSARGGNSGSDKKSLKIAFLEKENRDLV
jgi:hypothetical protein